MFYIYVQIGKPSIQAFCLPNSQQRHLSVQLKFLIAYFQMTTSDKHLSLIALPGLMIDLEGLTAVPMFGSYVPWAISL
jgi:hypothetical protein